MSVAHDQGPEGRRPGCSTSPTTDDEVIDAVERLLDTLKGARRAKAELAGLPPADLRAVLMFRANRRATP